MIKLVLPEDKPPEPERTVHFEFRRHKQADGNYPKTLDHLAYLVGREPVHGAFAKDMYPIKIDGNTKTVEVRMRSFELLGFRVFIQHEK